MNTTSLQVNPRKPLRTVAGLVVACLLGAIAVSYWLASRPKKLPYLDGRPLLQNDDELFTESQIGLQFTPPGNWSMQARSTEAPDYHKPERMVVKFKRLIPGLDVAWIRVSLIDFAGDQAIAEYLAKRKPPEPAWKITQPAKDMTLNGLPGARIVWGGKLDPDDKGVRDFICDITAVRRGDQLFMFAGTYLSSDAKALKRIRIAVESAVFSQAEFVTPR